MFLTVMTLASMCASEYEISFNQVGDKVVVDEIANQVNISSYVDLESLEKVRGGYVFLKRLVFPSDFDKATLKFNLGEGFIIGDSGVYPTDYKIETDGKRINLIWEFENVKKEHDIAIFVSIKDTGSRSFFLYLILIAVISILIVVGFYFFRKLKNKKVNKGLFEKHLIESEKKVIEELKKADRNEMWQKQIQTSTGFSKAKLSRVIRNLEARKLVRKIPMGNTNKISLSN